MNNTVPTKPDIEKILAEIRFRRPASDNPDDSSQDLAAFCKEEDLHTSLANANCHWLVKPNQSGLRLIVNKLLYKLLSSILTQINTFHSDIVRVLNKIVRILDGEDPAVLELTQLYRRKVTVTEMLAERLAAYDAARIEERLKALENVLNAQIQRKSS